MKVTMPVNQEYVASDVELAWAAGFFDGEGTTSVLKAQRDKYAYLRVSVSQKNPELLYKFQKIVGAGKIYKAKIRESYSFDCYRQEQSFRVLEKLWPFLGNQKKEQALKARQYVTQHSKGKVHAEHE